MQALAKCTEVILFGFEGVETQPFLERESETEERQLKFFLLAFSFKEK